MDFKDFKKNKLKILEKTKKLIKPTNSYADARFWVPSKDDAGNGEALIRFLPQKNVDQNPFILNFQHFFKEKGKWFVEKCPVTWDKPCPICDYVQPMWDGNKEEKDTAGKYGRKRQYFANILVIKDPAKSENNGKVFLYKFGKKIFEKILNKVSPESELDTPVTVYDLWEGMDFKLKIKKVYGFPNYDTSEFTGQITPVKNKDSEIEKIYNAIYALDEFLDEKDCKSEDALSEKFFDVIGKSNKNSIEKKEEKDIPFQTDEKTTPPPGRILGEGEKPRNDEDEIKTHEEIKDEPEDGKDDDDWNWDE